MDLNHLARASVCIHNDDVVSASFPVEWCSKLDSLKEVTLPCLKGINRMAHTQLGQFIVQKVCNNMYMCDLLKQEDHDCKTSMLGLSTCIHASHLSLKQVGQVESPNHHCEYDVKAKLLYFVYACHCVSTVTGRRAGP